MANFIVEQKIMGLRFSVIVLNLLLMGLWSFAELLQTPSSESPPPSEPSEIGSFEPLQSMQEGLRSDAVRLSDDLAERLSQRDLEQEKNLSRERLRAKQQEENRPDSVRSLATNDQFTTSLKRIIATLKANEAAPDTASKELTTPETETEQKMMPTNPPVSSLTNGAVRVFPTALSPLLLFGSIHNKIDDGSVGSVIGGGGEQFFPNVIFGDFHVIGGGMNNRAGGDFSSVRSSFATIGGGRNNVAEEINSTVGGGMGNQALGGSSFVGGGMNNSTIGEYASVLGGKENEVEGPFSSVVGGNKNRIDDQYAFIGGGSFNEAKGLASTISGGANNATDGDYATVAGGYLNEAKGKYSFAAGNHAKAFHDGVFVWADSEDERFVSTGSDQFLIRASGNVGIDTTSPKEKLTVAGNVAPDAPGTFQLGSPALPWSGVYVSDGIHTTSDQLRFFVNGKEVMGIDEAGNLFIMNQPADISEATVVRSSPSSSTNTAHTALSELWSKERNALQEQVLELQELIQRKEEEPTLMTDSNRSFVSLQTSDVQRISAQTFTNLWGIFAPRLNYSSTSAVSKVERNWLEREEKWFLALEALQGQVMGISNGLLSVKHQGHDRKAMETEPPLITNTESPQVPSVTTDVDVKEPASLSWTNTFKDHVMKQVEDKVTATVRMELEKGESQAQKKFEVLQQKVLAVAAGATATSPDASKTGTQPPKNWDQDLDERILATVQDELVKERVALEKLLRSSPKTISPSDSSGKRIPGPTGSFVSQTGSDKQPNLALGEYATVSGGLGNAADPMSAIGGGVENKAAGMASVISGGYMNETDQGFATVSGGVENKAHGKFSAVPGGQGNEALANYSFAAGHRAVARHKGSFVWADQDGSPFESISEDSFSVRAQGGVRFVDTELTASFDSIPGWIYTVQTPFMGTPVNSQRILRDVKNMSFVEQTTPDGKQVLVPAGGDAIHDLSLSVSSLVLIQELYRELEEQDAEMEALKKQVNEMSAFIDLLKKALNE